MITYDTNVKKNEPSSIDVYQSYLFDKSHGQVIAVKFDPFPVTVLCCHFPENVSVCFLLLKTLVGYRSSQLIGLDELCDHRGNVNNNILSMPRPK